ncbi:toll-like receptor 6 [Plutella xylostella]|uniref:toll-like receptor 6 n=1 Tax=Plutella xylostella TaxID=51655 RepID=UPI0020322C28|nr:toll-like receptor 6 [Plutella xylostella]
MTKNFYSMVSLKVWMCLVLVAGARARSAPPAPVGCQWDYSDAKLSESNFLTCNIKTIGSADFLFKNITTAQAYNINKLKLTCTDLLFFESSLHMNTGSFLGQLRKLEDLRIEYCKIRYVPATVLSPLRDLTSLTLRSYNTDWPAMTMEFHAESFRGLMELRSLDLGDNNIYMLPSEVFCPLFSLESLNLTNNRIQDISEIGFSDWGKGPIAPGKSCNTGLKMLDLSHNNVLRLPDNGLSSLRSLEVLKIQNNLINEIGDRAFVGLNSLKILNLSGNKLVAVPPELFQSSRVIKQISLANNSLSVLAPGLLEGLDQLEKLDLSRNRLTNDWVNRDTFAGLIRLVILNLSHNSLIRLDPKSFQDLNNLQVLNLDNNAIETISNGAFAELRNLHQLSISDNRMKALNEHIFCNLFVLSQLYLDNNQISVINERSFENITYLQDLGLNGNSLNMIPDGIKKLRFLKSLDVGKNNITKVSNTSFEGLEELYGLRLVDNHITSIPKDTFSTLPSLQVLNLASNKIENVEQDAFLSNPTLKAIRLDGNKLTDIRGVFNKLNTLGWLNISDNKLIYFDYSYMPESLEWLDIHSNNITKLDNEQNAQQNIRMLDVSYNALENVDERSIPDSIEVLFLNNNKIHTIHPGTFLQKRNLEKVIITDNKLRTVELSAFTLPHIPKHRMLPKFFIGNNPFVCNCHMIWLQKINLWNHMRQYPRFMDLDTVTCEVVNNKYGGKANLMDVPETQFLCSYETHCSSSCSCCDFEACDCKMACPEGCSCFHDSNWNSNVIDCSNVGYTEVPEKIPMDATELYLDGNDFGALNSHLFIGKKKLHKLYLNNSNIISIDNDTLNGLHSLNVLHLESNHLTELTGGEFSQTKHLRELYLNDNLLTSVANKTFESLSSLRIAHLQGNKILDLDKKLAHIVHLENVNVQGNLFTCTCANVMPLQNWFKKNYEDPADMFCASENGVTSNLTVYDVIDNCRDSSVTDNTIPTENQPYQFDEVSTIKLNFVPLLAVVLISVILILLFGALAFSFRQNVRLWAHSKYGVRLFKSASIQESELDRDRLYDGYSVYSLLDDDFVSKVIAPAMEHAGYTMCFHYRDLQLAHESYLSDQVTNAAESSKRILVFVSFNFLQNEWSKVSFKEAMKHVISSIHPSIRRHRVVFILTTDVSALNLDLDFQNYLKTCTVLLWGEKKFWEKIRFVMPDISNLQWNKDSLHYNHDNMCPNARRHPSRYTASPTAPEHWYKYDAIPPQTPTTVNVGINIEDDTSMLTNTTMTSQIQDGDPLHHSYISIDTQNYEQPYGGRPRPPNTLRKHPGHVSPSALDEQGYLQPRSSVHECLPQTHLSTHRL